MRRSDKRGVNPEIRENMETKMADRQQGLNPLGLFGAASEYMMDATQRSVLFFDVMRQRGEQYREHLAETVPHVLDYGAELIVDGRTLERPVNYGLVRVTPPQGVEIDLKRRPFVIVDPRAGHGPGIGGVQGRRRNSGGAQGGGPP